MAFSDWQTAILAHAVAAGAAITPAISDVVIGLPIPNGRCVRIHWDGEQQPVRMGANRDLTGELIAERIALEAYWPVSTNSDQQSQQITQEMYDFKHQLRTRVLGDSSLGGLGTDLEMEYAKPDFQLWGGALFATVTVVFVTDYVEYPLAAVGAP